MTTTSKTTRPASVAETTPRITEVLTRLSRFRTAGAVHENVELLAETLANDFLSLIEERDAALEEAARLRDENTRLEGELNELRWEDAGKWNV